MVFEKNVAGAWKHLDKFEQTSLYMLGQVWVSLDEFGSELILHFWIWMTTKNRNIKSPGLLISGNLKYILFARKCSVK